MCGYFEFDHDAFSAKSMLKVPALSSLSGQFRLNSGSGPASSVDMIIQREGEVTVAPAIWWLLLDRETLKPSRYTSFNTRSDKLHVRNSAGFHPYRNHRCIVPATGIVEGEGAKGNRRYHLIEPENTAFALGGLYKEWLNPETGEHAYSCSVITLPPHPKWQGIHSKSTPLFLPHDDSELIEKWLDPECDDVSQFEGVLKPELRDTLRVTPVDRPSSRVAVGDPFTV
ncbi:SOS response-associated peptidase family protein [Neptuniibacter sp.]|uniref:SOS response-associated peptidase family protein n=1 Tax=Neptuniibacter sp. TaxID=1962643 RepID=UPI00261BEC5D|nr:SOS response-associated peptidase family protein [Neptuniibacter sp.]MCP4597187.1 SOS response-associated peptidase [Neptuniibacter sp.]